MDISLLNSARCRVWVLASLLNTNEVYVWSSSDCVLLISECHVA